MKKNMGKIDRTIRIGIAIVLGIVIFLGLVEGLLANIALVAAFVMVITSLISFCPLYLPFGIKTNRKK